MPSNLIDLGYVRGRRGNRWFIGDGLVGDSIASGMLIESSVLDENALVNDFYLNNTTNEYYICVTEGDAQNSKWTYKGTLKGDQGPAFVYSNFTPSQLEALKGQKGDTGQRGQAFTFNKVGSYDDFNNLNTDIISSGYAFLITEGTNAGSAYIWNGSAWGDSFAFKGDKGDKGDTGATISELTSSSVNGVNTITLHMEDNTSYSFNILDGKDFKYDDFTSNQLQGLKGPRGYSVSTIIISSSNTNDGINVVDMQLENGSSIGSFQVKNGSKGSIWYTGAGLQGTGSNLTIDNTIGNGFESIARIDDFYLNTTTCQYYRCVVQGAHDVAKWDYEGTFQGKQGIPGIAYEAKGFGTLSQREDYNNESAGFVFFDTESGCIYIKGENNQWSNAIQIRGQKGDKGEPGVLFKPYISNDGILSWQNTGDQVNPTPVNLRTAGTNVICSPTPPSNPYRGLIWIQTSDTNTVSGYINVINTIVSISAPENVQNGTIWIKSSSN